MKIDTMAAIEQLEKLLAVMPEAEIKMSISKQEQAAALAAGIEALRVKAGYPPQLPGYVTLAKTDRDNVRKIEGMAKLEALYPDAVFYMTRKTCETLRLAYWPKKAPIYSLTPKNCYNDQKPLIFGLPVIFGDIENLADTVYLVTPEDPK